MRKFIALMFVFVLGTGTAFAAELDASQSHREGGPLVMPANVLNGSTTVSAEGDSRDAHGEVHGNAEWKLASTTREDLHKVVQILRFSTPGVVTNVSSNSFMMTVPQGKDHATTTLTVNVSSSTTFMHASSTAALADLTAGTYVVVFGKMSTSTKSIAADRVIIGPMMPVMHEVKKNVLDHIKDFFMGQKHASSTEVDVHASTTASTTPGHDEGFVRKLLKSIFGWL